MNRRTVARRASRWLGVGAVVAGGWMVGGCLQILGDDGTFVLDTTSAGGSGGSTSTGGNGAGGTTSSDVCSPGTKQACYSGPSGTQDLGNCKAGEQTCAQDGQSYGECVGQITPQAEDPTVVGDEACDGYAPGEAIWSAIYGDSGTQSISGLFVDDTTGDVIIVGTFESAIAIASDSFISGGANDIFVARLSAQGKPLWAKQLGGVGDQAALAIARGTDGSMVITGYSDAPWMVGNDMVPTGMFVLRLDNKGAPQWGQGCGGGLNSKLTVAVGSQNQVVVAGSFTDQFNCGDLAHTAVAGKDVFVAWFAAEGGPSLDSIAAGDGLDQFITSLALDKNDNILLAGTNKGSFSLGGESLPAFGKQAAFVAKLSSDGTHVWSHYITADGDVGITDAAVDALGGLVIGGIFAGKLYGFSNSVTADGPSDAFIGRVNAAGDIQWGKGFGGTNSTLQGVVGLAVDPNDDIVMVGAYFESMSFDGQSLPDDPGWVDGFVAKASGVDGSRKWAKGRGRISLLTGTVDQVTTTSKGFVVMAGSAESVFDLGNQPLTCNETDAAIGQLAP